MVVFLTVYQHDRNQSNPTGQINNRAQVLNTLTLIYGNHLGLN